MPKTANRELAAITGGILRSLMEEREVSQYRLAKDTGLDFGTIHKLYHGKHTPTATVINKFADYFGVSTDYLYGRKEQ